MTTGQKEPSMSSVESHFVFNNRKDLPSPPSWHPRIMSLLFPWDPQMPFNHCNDSTRRAIMQRLTGMIDSRSPIALDKLPGGQLVQMALLRKARCKGKAGLGSSGQGTTPICSERRPSMDSLCIATWDPGHVYCGKQDGVY